MSVRVMADVWDFGPSDPIDCSVLLVLANYCNDQGENCFPSIDRIAVMIRRSRSTVIRSLSSLEDGLWVIVVRGVGKGNVSQYSVNVELLKRCQAATFSEDEKVSADKPKGVTLRPKGVSDDIAIRKIHHDPPIEPSCVAELLFSNPTENPHDPRKCVERVWAYYREQTGKRYSSLTEQKLKMGLARYREALAKAAGDPEKAETAMRLAVDQLVQSDWHMGRDKNSNGKKYDSWEIMFRSADKFQEWVEKGIEE